MTSKPWYQIEYVAHRVVPGLSEVGLIISGKRYRYRADKAVVLRFLDMARLQRRKLPALAYLKDFAATVQRMNESR